MVPEQVQVGEKVLEEKSMEEHSQLQEAEHKAPDHQEAIMMGGGAEQESAAEQSIFKKYIQEIELLNRKDKRAPRAPRDE